MGSFVQRSVRAVVLTSGTAIGLSGLTWAGLGFAPVTADAATLSVARDAEPIVIEIGELDFAYAPGTSGPVYLDSLDETTVRLVRRSDGVLAAPNEASGESVTFALSRLDGSRTYRFTTAGLRAMLTAVHADYTLAAESSAYVVPDPGQILLRGDGMDYRGGDTDLTVIVYPGRNATPAERPTAGAAAAAGAEAVERAEAMVDDAETAAESVPDTAEARPDDGVIMETTDPEDFGREPPARSDRSEAEPFAAPEGEVHDPDELPVEDFEIDEDIDGATPFVMTGFEFSYPKPHPELPSIESLNDVTVNLIRTESGFIAREGEGLPVRLGDLGEGEPDRLYHSAFNASLAAILRAFRDRSIVGVLVTPDPDKGIGPDEIEGYYDERADYGVTSLPLLIYVPQVTRLKTIASGDRIETEDRLNSPRHGSVVRGSPLGPGDGEMPNALLRFEPLNTYAFFKSRHPGRRVDVAIADASVPGEPDTQGDAEVQYLVQETKPWTAYFQLSNTGTEETDEWRERFGLVHNQLFGFDDILSLDYITSNFRESHAVLGSYDIPISSDGRWRANLSGEWSEYEASDVGVANERFDGRTYGFGAEVRYNFLQIDDFFMDAYAGAKYRDIEVINRGLVDGKGQEEVFVTDFGVRAERRRAAYSLFGEVGLEVSMNDVVGADEAELERLGRLNPDEDWTSLHWDIDFSFYLDGFGETRGRQFVHELATRFSGQYAFNNRLIPNYQLVGGGLYSVRGYEESAVAGDSGVFGSVEYRFHLPNALPVDNSPPAVFGRPFRVAQDGDGLPPEWDLILKAFVDAGRVENSRSLGFESEETLLSTGLGLELQILNNFSFRTDWGIVLDEVGSDTPDPTDTGSSRWHFVFTVLY